MARFAAATDDGSYPTAGKSLHAGLKTVAVLGNYDGASVDLEVSLDDGTTWQSVHTFSAAAVEPKSLNYTGGDLRFTVSDADASTDLTFFIQ